MMSYPTKNVLQMWRVVTVAIALLCILGVPYLYGETEKEEQAANLQAETKKKNAPKPEKDSRDELLKTLHNKGVLTDDEYARLSESQKVQQVAEQKQQEEEKEKLWDYVEGYLPEALKGLSVSTQTFIDYSYGRDNDATYNRFALTRGYLTVKWKATDWLKFRFTSDIHREAGGDYKLRVKYAYMEFDPPDLGELLTDMKIEIGQGHMPWLDFEEHLNLYRVQGTMFIERAGIFNSADLGVSIRGYFGGQLDDEYKKRISKYYAGMWGSWHIGMYNGGGYHANENNNNKTFESRLTLRPFGPYFPNLQVSYLAIIGEGNTEQGGDFPVYNVHMLMWSFQHEYFVFTATYARTVGNASGALINASNNALRGEGLSFFLEIIPPVLDGKFSIISRYDWFDPDRNDRVVNRQDSYRLWYVGAAYRFYHHCKVITVFEKTEFEDNSGGRGRGPVPGNKSGIPDDYKLQVAVEIDL